MDGRKNRLKTGLIVAFVVIGLVIFFNFPKILSLCNKMYVQTTKKESTVTKILTMNEFSQLKLYQGDVLYYKYDEKWKTKWLSKEIRQGYVAMLNDYYFVLEHPDYDSVKIKFNVIKYKVDGKTVEFMSKSKIIQVHSKNGWKNIVVPNNGW